MTSRRNKLLLKMLGTTTGETGLKVNNNYTAFAARDLMDQYPDLKGFFQLREQRPRGNWGQLH